MKETQKQLIIEIMNEDAKDGLYKKQTAVDWLTEKVNSKEWQDMYIWHKEEVFKQAKEMEKEQIIRAFVVAEGAEYEGIKYGVHYYRKTYLKDA